IDINRVGRLGITFTYSCDHTALNDHCSIRNDAPGSDDLAIEYLQRLMRHLHPNYFYLLKPSAGGDARLQRNRSDTGSTGIAPSKRCEDRTRQQSVRIRVEGSRSRIVP